MKKHAVLLVSLFFMVACGGSGTGGGDSAGNGNLSSPSSVEEANYPDVLSEEVLAKLERNYDFVSIDRYSEGLVPVSSKGK